MKYFLLPLIFIQIALSASGEIPWIERNLWPESPQANGIRQAMMPAPSLLTGAAEFDIPVYTIQVEGFELPVGLHYRTNGIKPTDDPQPIGYGWVLDPPLRVSRQVCGYPDELSTWKGDEETDFTGDNYMEGYRVAHAPDQIERRKNSNMYDTMHDLFTVYLPGKILRLVYVEGSLKGVGCGEYRIENDALLTYIKVTDPQGNAYRFATQGEAIDYPGLLTEWLLTDITLISGTKIEASWEQWSHVSQRQNALHPTTIYYDYDTYEREADDGAYTEFHKYFNTKNLKSLSFPGGVLGFEYTKSGDRDMLSRVTLKSGQTTLRTVTLTQTDNLLTSVEIGGEGQWSFSYDAGRFVSHTSLDWWGYHNGKVNGGRLSPAVHLGMRKDGGYYGGADRSVSAASMSANILKKVTYPTGGTCEWEYEVHRFPKQEPEDWEKSYLKNAFSLSEGGGLRVKSITQRENASDPSPRVRTYTYGTGGNGLGNVTSVPLLSTFISETPMLRCRSLNNEGGGIAIDNCLTVNRFSSYLDSRPGALPVWYSTVVETEGEGKTEYRFSDLCGEDVVDTFWGERYPVSINTAFSEGPQLMSRTVYKGFPGSYSAVEKEEFEYELCVNPDIEELRGLSVTRNYVYFYNSHAPDFGPETQNIVWTDDGDGQPGNDVNAVIVDRDRFDWFYVRDTYINPKREQLTSRKLTTYHSNGSRTVSETFNYMSGTSLPTETKTVCGDQSSTLKYIYGNGQSSMQLAAMSAANVRIPLDVRKTFGNAVTGYTLQMSRWGSVFRPEKVWLMHGNLWSTSDYAWDSKGNLTGRTGTDGVTEAWTYDLYGNPLSHTTGGSLKEEAVWSHLVGVTSLKEPSGVTHGYSYDPYGRLSAVRLNSRILESLSYNISQGGDSYIRSAVNSSSSASSKVTKHYDGLGREWGIFTELPESRCLASATGYDAMGRAASVWSPVTVSAAATLADVQSAARNLYSETYPYSSTLYEESPRGVRTGEIRAGDKAHSTGSRQTIERYVNDASAYSCIRYKADSDGVSRMGLWQTGTLLVERSKDEEGHWIETYTDFRNLTLCRKEDGASTYFVYDDYGQLRYILPPGVSGTCKRTDSVMSDLAYWYDYDSRGRMTLKKLPGVSAASMVYDPSDRLVGEHSAHHPTGYWRLYGYDSCGRQVVTVDFSMTDEQVSAYASQCHTSVLQSGGSFAGYTMPGAPSYGKTITANYYDNYDFLTVNSLSSAFNWSATGAAFSFANPGTVSDGLLTGVYTGKGYESYYYNRDGQLMESYGTGFNNLRTNYTYTYRGDPARKWWTLTDGSVRSLEWSYDSSGRLTGMKSSMNGSTGTSSQVNLSYNEMGRICEEKYTKGSKVMGYDSQGRIVQQYVPSYSLPLSTYALPPVIDPVLPPSRWGEILLYDGAGRLTKKITKSNTYNYTYDSRGRLTGAGTRKDANDFSVTYSYDTRSNITSLKRNGVVDRAGTSEFFGVLDNLTMNYTGNRLTSFRATTEALPFEGMTGIGKEGSYTLSYDSGGRLTADPSRGITSIQYDNDGRPIFIRMSDGHEQSMEWDGFGNHISTRYTEVSATGRPYDRLTRTYTGDGRVLDNWTEAYARFPGGYMKGGEYFRYVTDYQGNNVAVLNSEGMVEQQTDYYPYGEPWREPSGQPWLYGGNERLRMYGVNEYDFNARRYNSALGSFTTWDPLCEKYPWLSTYSYCGGDPINAIDKNGKLIIFINGMHFGDGGRSDYWGSFFNAFVKAIGDRRALFFDGAVGGINGIFSNRRGISNHTAHGRYLAGKERGRKVAKSILGILKDNETIKFVSHSMGGAYTKGFIEEIINYGNRNGVDVLSLIEWEIDLAPFQPGDQRAVNGVTTLSVQHYEDGVAGIGDMPNSYVLRLHKGRFRLGSKEWSIMFKEHSIESFTEDIDAILNELSDIFINE
ncbi:MAG: hypothetical protein K2J82_02755 [Muribaculaceae bacterium]|nr:hypothetical protein [Muribaculaceae bacterium]